MRIIQLALSGILVLSFVGCVPGADVRSTFGKDVEFSEYTTWAFAPVLSRSTGDPRLDDPRLNKQIKEQITKHLTEQGYRFVIGESDMIVNFNTAIGRSFDETQLDNLTYEHGSGITDDIDLDTGRIVVIIFDAKTGKALWGGSAEGEVNERLARSHKVKRINNALAEMFKGFTTEAFDKHLEAEAAAE